MLVVRERRVIIRHNRRRFNVPLGADAVRTITREEGALALYKGAVPALLLCGQGAVQFAVYEWLKARVPKQNENVRRLDLKREYDLLCWKLRVDRLLYYDTIL